MSRSDFYPDPPHVSATFCLDRASPQDAFAAVCAKALDAKAEPTGSLEIVRADHFPRFASISDLAPNLEALRLEVQQQHDLDTWSRWVHAQDPHVHVISAALYAPRAGG